MTFIVKYNKIYKQTTFNERNMISKHEPKTNVNLKEQNAAHSFRLTIRDTVHFYKIVDWLNKNVGKGSNFWTMEGRVLRHLKRGETVSPKIYIFKPDFDANSALYLSLL